jgi:hypothetical protein
MPKPESRPGPAPVEGSPSWTRLRPAAELVKRPDVNDQYHTVTYDANITAVTKDKNSTSGGGLEIAAGRLRALMTFKLLYVSFRWVFVSMLIGVMVNGLRWSHRERRMLTTVLTLHRSTYPEAAVWGCLPMESGPIEP